MEEGTTMEGRSETMQEEMVLELAKAIHSEYNRHRLLDSQDRPLEYPDWDALPENIRNSNIRQARSIPAMFCWFLPYINTNQS